MGARLPPLRRAVLLFLLLTSSIHGAAPLVGASGISGFSNRRSATAAASHSAKPKPFPSCPAYLCDCRNSMVSDPNPTPVSNMLTSMEEVNGMLVSSLAPTEYWKTDQAADSLPSVGERLKVAYGLDVAGWGEMVSSQGAYYTFTPSTKMLDVLSLRTTTPSTTTLRGNGDGYYYGDTSQRISTDTGGYLYRWISSRNEWPDPVEWATGGCPGDFDSCANYTFSSQEGVRPTLYASVWASMIGPLQRDWTYYLLQEKTGIPVSDVQSLQLIGFVLPAIEFSLSQALGGVFEYPAVTEEEQALEIVVESNLVLFAAASLSLELIKYQSGGNPRLSESLRSLSQTLLKFFDGSKMTVQNETGSLAFDGSEGVFRTSILVESPKSQPEDVILTGDWDVSTQLTALAVLGTDIDTMFPNKPFATYNLWSKLRTTYGVFIGESLVGLSSTAGGSQVDSVLTIRAVQAGRDIAKSFAAVENLTAANFVGTDTETMHGRNPGSRGGYVRFGCQVLPNVTAPWGSWVPEVDRYGYLSDIGTITMGASSWVLVGLDASPFSFAPIPSPPVPTPGPDSPDTPADVAITTGQTVLTVMGAIFVAAAVVVIGVKGMQSRKRRADYAEIMQATDLRGGEDLGFY